MTIRVEVAAADSEIALALIAELSAELGAIYNTDGSAMFTPDDVKVARAAFVVAYQDGEALGCGAIRPMDDVSIAEVKRMYVRPAARGRGVSRLILQKLEELAVEYDYAALWLETGIHQKAAVALYEKTSYKRRDCWGEYATDPLSLCYEKNLMMDA